MPEVQSKKVVLLGFGETSRPLAKQIHSILAERYHLNSQIPPEVEDIEVKGRTSPLKARMLFRDREPGSRMRVDSCQATFPGSLVYVTQRTRVYDDELEFWARTTQGTLATLRTATLDHPLFKKALLGATFTEDDPHQPTPLSQIYERALSDLERQLEKFWRVVDTGQENLYAAVRSVPDTQLRKAKMYAERARRYGAESVVLVTPKTSFEWTHNQKKYLAQGIDETNNLRMTVRELRLHGFDTWLAMHFHAPGDVLTLSREEVFGLPKLRVIDVNPQSFVTVDGERMDLEKIFQGFGGDYNYYHPFGNTVDELIRTKKESVKDEDLARRMILVDCPDLGAISATEEVARRYGLQRITSEKDRFGEGSSSISRGDSLYQYLENLTADLRTSGISPDLNNPLILSFYLFDDKLNSGTTAVSQSLSRKEQVDIFNRGIHASCFNPDGNRTRAQRYEAYILRLEAQAAGRDEPSVQKEIQFLKEHPEGHLTTYIVEYCLATTHLRAPDLRRLKHADLDSILVSDSVPYFPEVMAQLAVLEEEIPELRGISQKLTILPFSAEQTAAGIALDVYLKDSRYRAYVDSLR
jgi:hypothetical protein